MTNHSYVEHTVDAKQIKCRVIVIVDAEHTVYYLVVCNGTNNYVNPFLSQHMESKPFFKPTYGKF